MFGLIGGSLAKYFDFKGKATRKEFWTFYGFYIFAIFVGGFIDGLLGNSDVYSGIALFGLYIPTLSCAIRRMHDAGKRGWFILIPFANLALLLTPSVTEEQDA